MTIDIKINGKLVSCFRIINDGTGTVDIGNYDVLFTDEKTSSMYKYRGYQREHGPTALAYQVLNRWATFTTMKVEGGDASD